MYPKALLLGKTADCQQWQPVEKLAQIIAKDSQSIVKPSAQPRAIIVTGLPASGKSTAIAPMLKDKDRLLPINLDDVFPMLPGYNGANSGRYLEVASSIADAWHYGR